jgi:hypothetical protein
VNDQGKHTKPNIKETPMDKKTHDKRLEIRKAGVPAGVDHSGIARAVFTELDKG